MIQLLQYLARYKNKHRDMRYGLDLRARLLVLIGLEFDSAYAHLDGIVCFRLYEIELKQLVWKNNLRACSGVFMRGSFLPPLRGMTLVWGR